MNPDRRADLGARIRELRLAKQLTQEDVAQRAGVAAKTVYNVEAGHIMPRRLTRRALAEALGVTAEDLEAVAS